MTRACLACAAVLVAACVVACDRGGDQSDAASAPAPIDNHECAACGMVVREQNAPRAQLVHRDATRKFFCSVSDMLTYMEAPSPHGKVSSVFVEVLEPDSPPGAFDTAEKPWLPADEASYVMGVDRPRVMGTPILVYEQESDARSVAEASGGAVFGWEQLPQTALR